MKHIYIFIALLLWSSYIFAQKHDYVWLMGYGSNPINTTYGGTVIDFNTSPPDLYYEFRSMRFRQANASMCDTAGNLLFYTNGIYIANALHQPMENGTGLNPGVQAENHQNYGYILEQGVLALPAPENDSLFYLFHIDNNLPENNLTFHTKHLYYTLINYSANGGLGTVVSKNNIIISDILDMGKLTAVKHGNGEDWWLLARRYNSNEYHKILLSSKGIVAREITSAGLPLSSQSIGQAVFSPDGSKYANVHLTGSAGDPIYVSIYDFDRCSGELSNPIQFTYADTAWAGGIAISPNSRFLYVSSFRYVYQYDLHAQNIEASRITIAEWDGFYDEHPNFSTTFYLAQLAPDGKIYINSSSSTRYLHVINHPDSLGPTCDLCQHCVQLPTKNSFSLPNFPNYRLHHLEGSPCDTLRQPPVAEWQYDPLGLEVAFQDAAYHDIRAWHWSFGDGATDTVPNPIHSYAAEGTYNVCLAVSNPRGADTLCREVQVLVSRAGETGQGGTSVAVWPNPVPPGVPATLVAEGIPATEVFGTIRDALGRTVCSFITPVANGRIRQELDMRGLPAGVYFVALVSESGVSLGSGKLMVRP